MTGPDESERIEAGDGSPAFDALVSGGALRDDREAVVVPRGRGWLVGSIGAALAGALAIAGGLLIPPHDGAAPAAPPVPVARPEPVRTPAPPDAPSVAPVPSGIADLADRAWVADLARRTAIPERALRAYAGASLRVRAERAGCGLGWNTLAAIGHVESEHGTHGGSWIGPSGDPMAPIVGIPLDGTASAAIADTDGGALDGDAVWDRAVGPMQFIPSTWARWGADGNGDGVADPQNIDDAALSAGRYLCEAGGDLTDPAGWIAAVAAYNDAVEYNLRVAEAAERYAGPT